MKQVRADSPPILAERWLRPPLVDLIPYRMLLGHEQETLRKCPVRYDRKYTVPHISVDTPLSNWA